MNKDGLKANDLANEIEKYGSHVPWTFSEYATKIIVASLRMYFSVVTKEEYQGELMSVEDIVGQLIKHRTTHVDWAEWLENNPNDPIVEKMGDAAFHRKMERHYDKMIASVKHLAKNG
jgi:hypothetical protein